ncbi:hypothetical protein [Methylocapsa sp. S129]|uniref:hypothetical protein n=1 Tax=Methylocapsa sp. S129 TaxID=1641869 RepID=UPI00131AFFE7|nr:hypothetical protein [Methylocapsa sp. S129]
MRNAAVTLCLLAAVGPATAADVEYDNKFSHVKVVYGTPSTAAIRTNAPLQEDILINGWAFESGCESIQVSDEYRVAVAPQHGVICFRREKAIVKAKGEKSSCIGRELMSLNVYYRPNGSYIGTDAFGFDLLHNGRVRTVHSATITVLPPLGPLPKVESPSDQEQPGLMPRCPDDIT